MFYDIASIYLTNYLLTFLRNTFNSLATLVKHFAKSILQVPRPIFQFMNVIGNIHNEYGNQRFEKWPEIDNKQGTI
jgi:hypothetical protein